MSLLPKNLETLKRNAKKNIMPLLTPYLLKLRINTYAPYIGAGIKIEHINLDQGLCVVNMGLRSEEHTSELQSRENLVCRLLLEKKKTATKLLRVRSRRLAPTRRHCA